MENAKKQIIIYIDDINEYIANNKDYIINQLQENDDPINDESIMQAAYYLLENDDKYLLNEYINNFDLSNNKILVVASFGLWYGKRQGKAIFNSLKDAIYKCCYDSNKIYFDNKNTTLKMRSIHHDGINKYKFYKLVNNKKYAIKYKEFLDL